MFSIPKWLFDSSKIDLLIKSLKNEEWHSVNVVVGGCEWILESNDGTRRMVKFSFGNSIKIWNEGAGFYLNFWEKRKVSKVVEKFIISGKF